MDFAKGLLMKYGWQEGQGIGKNEDGIVKPIKANLKFDNTGLDYDKASEFTNHWWERVFNSAADNLNINTSVENVSLSVKDNDIVQVSTSGFSTKNLKNKDYAGYFHKSNKKLERLEEDDQSESENGDNFINFKQAQVKTLNDEEILKACGGRTAHKGARHGLSLSGKLSRIEAQEKQLLAQNQLNPETATNIFQNWVQVKKKRKNRNKTNSLDVTESNTTTKCSTSSPDSDTLNGLIDEHDYQIKSKSRKKKKQQRERDEELAKSISQLSASESNLKPETSTSDKCFQADLKTVQSKSKAIKKVKHNSKKKHRRKNRAMETDEDTTDNGYNEKKRRAKNKSNAFQIEGNLSDFSSSECDEKEIQEDPLVRQIAEVMKKYPSKRFKVIAEELTPFQKKHLRKSGLRIELKSTKKRDKKKRIKERAQLEKISKKIEKAMVFNS